MNTMESIRLALEGLRANKMRSLLTMLGIIIGIGSVIAILTVGGGLSGSITDSMSSLGASNITVFLQQRDSDTSDMQMQMLMGGGNVPEAEDLITEEMIDALVNRYPDAVRSISISENLGSGQAKDGREYANVSVTGINDGYLSANSINLLQGRSFMARDLNGYRSLAIVSDRLVDNLFRGDTAAALGQDLIVHLNNEIHAFRVIGVYQYEQSVMGMSTSAEQDISTSLYIPITNARRISGSNDGYQSLTIAASSEVDSATFAQQAEDFLNQYYAATDDYLVSAMSMESMLDSLNTMMNTVNIALSVIAGISLLVGGIGVMNIMLVSVTERTREIGTRKAIGATNANIRMQFVVESTIVCLIGGIIGTILGGVLGYAGSSLLGSASGPSLSSIAIAVGFSMVIGIFFGYYPANKAAQLDPIEALRYE